MSLNLESPVTPAAGYQSKWIERYITELVRWTPAVNRAAAEADARAMIAQTLAASPEKNESAVLAALKALGAPQRLALQYGGGRSLIGPLLYPIFLRVLQIVLTIMLALNLFGLFFAIGWQQESVSPVEVLVDILASMFQATGVVVLIFAVIERTAHIQAKDLDKEWSPKSLPAAQENDRIRAGETIFEIVANIVAIVVLAFFLDRVGAYYVPGQGWSSLQIFSAHFQSFVPWLILWLALDTLLTIAVLGRGYWQPLTRTLKIALNLAALALAALMLTGDALLTIPAIEIVAPITISIIMVVVIIDSVAQIRRIARRSAERNA